MAENRRERDKRFYFSRGQMLMLGGAFILASVTIFSLGMYVGKSIEARKMVKPEEPLIKFPVKPTVQAPVKQPNVTAKEEPVVFETQTKVAVPQTPAQEIPKAGKAAEPAARIEAVKESKAPVKEPAAVNVAEKAEKPLPEPAKKAAAEESESKDTINSGKNWRVQVNAFPDELAAKQLVDRLKNKSYNAYITEGRNKGKIWYRVSVGKFGSREEADKVLDTLKAKENFPKAFATTQ